MAGAESHFRGHLFADLRGSTAYTERAGNEAGAELVRRFRQLVRAEVAQHEGAEVKTEGDAIYVVFSSTSTAVMCGLAIIAAAEAIAESEPEMPMYVGVGVHAGEAVAIAEGGYIGTAVNLAARVCAAAGPDELLVTGTVHGITRASIPVTFVRRGKRKLKGIAEPVELYLVLPEGRKPEISRLPSRRAAALAAVIPVVLVVVVAAAFISQPKRPLFTPTPPPPPPVEARFGSLPIGQYVLPNFQPRFTFSVPDSDWSLAEEDSAKLRLVYDGDPQGRIDVGKISTVYTEPCIAGGDNLRTVNTSQDLLEALRAVNPTLQPGENPEDLAPKLHISDPQPIFVGDVKGLIIDVSVDTSVVSACSNDVAVFPLGGVDYITQPSVLFRIYILDVGSSNVAFVVTPQGGAETPVEKVEQFFALAERLIDKVRF